MRRFFFLTVLSIATEPVARAIYRRYRADNKFIMLRKDKLEINISDRKTWEVNNGMRNWSL